MVVMFLWSLLFFSSCSSTDKKKIDNLNSISYAWHYRNLDSTRVYANKALRLSDDYDEGKAEALNNLAFVSMAHMDYAKVIRLISHLDEVTDNQVELLIADIQLMRLCQRQSHNKEFYDYRERALRRLRRIDEERGVLSDHQKQRMIYAHSEIQIITSTYFYYVGLTSQSVAALDAIDPNGEILQDTAQVLNYYYNVGAGGIITNGTPEEINQTEFDYLMRCYLYARQSGYIFFEAQSLQGLSEHLNNLHFRDKLIANNLPAMKFINIDNMPDSLIAGNLALRASNIFKRYGDVYQIAGSYRTLAECYWTLKDYRSALVCLQNALCKDTVIERAPDLVASIREQLSLAYSAIDDKPNSDYNRNIYLDKQEQTRQDRQLEARADQLDKSSSQLSLMIIAVIVMILLVVFLLVVFGWMRKRNDSKYSIVTLLKPLEKWKEKNEVALAEEKERKEEIDEETQLAQLHVLQNKKRNIEQRAKISLVNSITPFIDRIIHDVKLLKEENEPKTLKEERFAYIAELTDKINEYNTVLTNWIQLRQGELSLHIESFPINDLFEIVRKGKMSFQLKGVDLKVEKTPVIVKADKALTLFMINTLADNARKFTPKGGEVLIYAQEEAGYIEINVSDTGIGMTEEQLDHLFDHKPIVDENGELKEDKSHGFGLMNCKGIIDKYKKISQIFSVCSIGAESKTKGSRFWFRLPKGITRLLLVLFLMTASVVNAQEPVKKSAQFADSAYFSNIAGTYQRTLDYADSCVKYMNLCYKQLRPSGRAFMKLYDRKSLMPAELQWFHDSLHIDNKVILDFRNEAAVAALALHKWDLYNYNNKVYTQLFRETSSDNTLGNYVYVMQKSETNKNVAIILLVLLLIFIIPAYYMLYYRHRLNYRFNIERINNINEVLLSDMNPEKKYHKIEHIWNDKRMIISSKFAPLDDLVNQIKSALKQSMDANKQQQTDIEMAADELRRSLYENAKLHISNNVLDNCLSTLKHETMYYPSRIHQLIDNPPCNLSALAEVVDYYKALYTILSSQAMLQIEGMARVDNDMIKYLFEILQKLNGDEKLEWNAQNRDDKHVILTTSMRNIELSELQCQQLFSPLTVNVQYLLCRQIVRDIGEATNARACGISASKADKGIIINIILPKDIWKNSKL